MIRSALLAGIERNEIHCVHDGCVVGFVHWHLRRDGWSTIYEIATSTRRQGLGRMLLNSVPRPLQLKCP
ncbi:MAG: hypothetical protein NTX54_00235, partial [Chloroflexi bacterium]|nr:hypothetical protein [Chloroflexota bacterium]